MRSPWVAPLVGTVVWWIALVAISQRGFVGQVLWFALPTTIFLMLRSDLPAVRRRSIAAIAGIAGTLLLLIELWLDLPAIHGALIPVVAGVLAEPVSRPIAFLGALTCFVPLLAVPVLVYLPPLVMFLIPAVLFPFLAMHAASYAWWSRTSHEPR